MKDFLSMDGNDTVFEGEEVGLLIYMVHSFIQIDKSLSNMDTPLPCIPSMNHSYYPSIRMATGGSCFSSPIRITSFGLVSKHGKSAYSKRVSSHYLHNTPLLAKTHL